MAHLFICDLHAAGQPPSRSRPTATSACRWQHARVQRTRVQGLRIHMKSRGGGNEWLRRRVLARCFSADEGGALYVGHLIRHHLHSPATHTAVHETMLSHVCPVLPISSSRGRPRPPDASEIHSGPPLQQTPQLVSVLQTPTPLSPLPPRPMTHHTAHPSAHTAPQVLSCHRLIEQAVGNCC